MFLVIGLASASVTPARPRTAATMASRRVADQCGRCTRSRPKLECTTLASRAGAASANSPGADEAAVCRAVARGGLILHMRSTGFGVAYPAPHFALVPDDTQGLMHESAAPWRQAARLPGCTAPHKRAACGYDADESRTVNSWRLQSDHESTMINCHETVCVTVPAESPQPRRCPTWKGAALCPRRTTVYRGAS